MSRTADYTIQGFIYQFIITLQKILDTTDDSEITIEGVIEDIDILTPLGYEVYQCKYHECKSKFTMSDIYKPVLQMLLHFKNNPTANIKYRLHAHFPNELVGSIRKLSSDEIQQILSTTAKEFTKHISLLNGFTKIKDFLDLFEIHFGASLIDAENAVIVALSREGFSTEDASEIFYPNAIHIIAEYSIKHIKSARVVRKTHFINHLRDKKKTAISRWTRELQSYEKFLKKRKRQLWDSLNNNYRTRAIIIDADYISDFENKTSHLISEFINKYNNKPKLNQCPVVSLISSEDQLNLIWKKLSSKGIIAVRGIEAGIFDVKRFLRQPLKNGTGIVEFKVRLCKYDPEFNLLLAENVFDDIFIISDKEFSFGTDIENTIEQLRTSDINEVKYLLSLITTL